MIIFLFNKFNMCFAKLGAQKNCLIKMFLLSTHNVCFGAQIKKSNYVLLSMDWSVIYIQDWHGRPQPTLDTPASY